jgi:hypothetical protein
MAKHSKLDPSLIHLHAAYLGLYEVTRQGFRRLGFALCHIVDFVGMRKNLPGGAETWQIGNAGQLGGNGIRTRMCDPSLIQLRVLRCHRAVARPHWTLHQK